MKVKVLILIIFVSTLGCKDRDSTLSNVNQKYSKIMKSIIPEDLKHLRLLDESDFKIEDYEKNYSKNAEKVYQDNLNLFKNREKYDIIVERDFNKNGKIDIALSCVSPMTGKSYLVIIEKEKEFYSLIKVIKLEATKFLIKREKPNTCDIYINYLEGDWGDYICWEGEDYIIKVEDPYGA